MSVTVWKIMEETPQGDLLTIECPWNGSRHLPRKRWLKSQPFAAVMNGRQTQMAGFHAFTDQAFASSYLQASYTDRPMVLVEADAIGITPKHDSLVYCDQIKLHKVVERRV